MIRRSPPPAIPSEGRPGLRRPSPPPGHASEEREEKLRAKPTVFLVDDDPAALQAIASVVSSAGLSVQTYHSVKGFLKRFNPARPGCVVCDEHISGKSGVELLERLRASGSEIPVLFLTSRGDVPTAVSAIKAGAIDVLEKPVPDPVLLAHVRRAIADDAAHRAARPGQAELAARYHSLSERERTIFACVVHGLSNREIAERLGASPKTVEMQRGNMMRKMRAEHVAHLVRMSSLLPVEPTCDLPPAREPPAAG